MSAFPDLRGCAASSALSVRAKKTHPAVWRQRLQAAGSGAGSAGIRPMPEPDGRHLGIFPAGCAAPSSAATNTAHEAP